MEDVKGTVRILGELKRDIAPHIQLTISLEAAADLKSALEDLMWEVDEDGEVCGVDWESGDGGQALFNALNGVLFAVEPEPKRFTAMISVCDIQAQTEAEARKMVEKCLGYFPHQMDPHIEEIRQED